MIDLKILAALLVALLSFGTLSSAETSIIHVTGLHIAQKNIGLYQGEQEQVQAVVQPANATNKQMIWSSDHPEIAAVDANGKVMA